MEDHQKNQMQSHWNEKIGGNGVDIALHTLHHIFEAECTRKRLVFAMKPAKILIYTETTGKLRRANSENIHERRGKYTARMTSQTKK